MVSQKVNTKSRILLCSWIIFLHFRLDKELKGYEKGKERYSKDSNEYLLKLQQLQTKKQKNHLEKIHGLACERWFLLKLKDRYAGNFGHSMTI